MSLKDFVKNARWDDLHLTLTAAEVAIGTAIGYIIGTGYRIYNGDPPDLSEIVERLPGLGVVDSLTIILLGIEYHIYKSN